MNEAIRKKIEDNYVTKEANHIAENSYDIDFEDIIRHGIKPVSDVDVITLLIYGYDCDSCGGEDVLHGEMREDEVGKIIKSNKCKHCGEKIFL